MNRNKRNYEIVDYMESLGLNAVSFSTKTKKTIGASEVYTEHQTWHERYRPQRYDLYSSKVMVWRGSTLGVALPSKEASDKVFNGIICLDLDTRGKDSKVVWDKMIKWLYERGLATVENVEKKGDSFHVWVQIPRDTQLTIVKGSKYKTSAKLRVTDDSSIDLIFGGKCIRTAHPGSLGYTMSKTKYDCIQWDKLPQMSNEMLAELLGNEHQIFTHVDYKKNTSDNLDVDVEVESGKYDCLNLSDILRLFFNIDELERQNSYSIQCKQVPHLGALELLLDQPVGEVYMGLFTGSAGNDTGILRGIENVKSMGINHSNIEYTRKRLDILLLFEKSRRRINEQG